MEQPPRLDARDPGRHRCCGHRGDVASSGGGTLALFAEGGRDEAVVPLRGGRGFGNSYQITVHALDPRSAAEAVLRAIVDLERTGRVAPGTTGAVA